MFPKDEELNRDILEEEGGFIAEDGYVRSVENGKLTNFLHANQPDDLSKGKSASSIKKFFDYIALHVILPWLRALTEKINAIPAWAKQATKPSYTAEEVGALPNTYVPPDQTAEQVGADPAGTALSKVGEHNVDTTSHNDLRLLIRALTDRLNAVANSEDVDLDQMKELVEYIKSNRSLIESVTTSKVSVSDIIDNLSTNAADKPLSAAQGVALKRLIDALADDMFGEDAFAEHNSDEEAHGAAGRKIDALQKMVYTSKLGQEDIEALKEAAEKGRFVVASDEITAAKTITDIGKVLSSVGGDENTKCIILELSTDKLYFGSAIDIGNASVDNESELKLIFDKQTATLADFAQINMILNQANALSKLERIFEISKDLAVENNEVSYTLQNPLEKIIFETENPIDWHEFIYINGNLIECYHNEPVSTHIFPDDLAIEHGNFTGGDITWAEGAEIKIVGDLVTGAILRVTVHTADAYMKKSELPDLKQETVDAVLAALPTWEGGSY